MRRRKKRMNPVGAVLIVLVVLGGLAAAAGLIRALYALASGENALELSEKAEEVVHKAILERTSLSDDAVISAEDHLVLGSEVRETRTTVYMWVYTADYAEENGALKEIRSSHVPAALTFRDSYGEIQIEEYRTPRDGADFEADVKEIFPVLLRRKALEPAPFGAEQQERCRAKAEESFAALKKAAAEAAVPQPDPEAEAERTPEPSTPPQPLTEDLTPKFPVKAANRAALTAMTNYYASDVRNSDGTYHTEWFHAYSDTSGETEKYLIYDWQTGIWTGKDADTWHVDFMELNGADGRSRVVSMDVSFDGSEYRITNAEDLTDDSGGEIDTELPPFRVSQYLIAEDRVFE